MSDRFLYIDIFTRLTGSDSGQRVPVVTRGDRHSIHRGVVRDAPHILFDLGPLAADLLDGLRLFATASFVDIAYVK